MFIIEGYKSGKCVMVMSVMEDILECELLRKELKKRFENISFAILTLEVIQEWKS